MVKKRVELHYLETQKDLETSYSLENNGERESVGGALSKAAPLYLSNGQNSDDILASFENLPYYTSEQIVTQKLILNLKTCGITRRVKKRCKHCDNVVDMGVHELHCQCGYCKKLGCFKARYGKAKLKIMSWFGKTARLKEFVMALEYEEGDLRKIKRKGEIATTKFISALKRSNNELAGIKTFDFLKKGDKYFVHFHFLVLPMEEKYFDIRKWNRIKAKVEKETKTKFHISMGQYKPKNRAIGYTANRIAGQYGHKKDGNSFMLQDLVSVEDYVKIFYRMRRYTKFGNLQRLKAFFRLALSSILGLSDLGKCEKCGSEAWSLEFYDINDEEPPPTTCSECGLVVLEEDFVKYECLPYRHERDKVDVENVCSFCYEKSAVKKMKDLWSEFHSFISARESAENIMLHPTTRLTSAEESGV